MEEHPTTSSPYGIILVTRGLGLACLTRWLSNVVSVHPHMGQQHAWSEAICTRLWSGMIGTTSISDYELSEMRNSLACKKTSEFFILLGYILGKQDINVDRNH